MQNSILYLSTLLLNMLVLVGFIVYRQSHNESLRFQSVSVSCQSLSLIVTYFLYKRRIRGYRELPLMLSFISFVCDLLAVLYAFVYFTSPSWFIYCAISAFLCRWAGFGVCICVNEFREMRNEQHQPLLNAESERAVRIASNRSALVKYTERIGIHFWTINNPGTAEFDCPICKEPYKENDVLHVYECKHSCHVQCSMGWLVRKRECLLCKEPVNSAVEEV